MICKIVETPIETDKLINAFQSESLGATCSFTGMVRGESRGQIGRGV